MITRSKVSKFFIVFFMMALITPGGLTIAEDGRGVYRSIRTDETLEGLFKQEKRFMKEAAENPDDTEIDMKMADLRAAIAVRLYRDDDFPRAIDYLYNSLHLNPDHAERWELFGDLSNFIGHPSSSYIVQYAYEKALEIEPQRNATRLKLAGSYLQSDRILKAIHEFETVMMATEGQMSWDHLVLLTTSYSLVDQVKRGIQFYERNLERSNNNQVRIALAILKHASGEKESAVGLLSIAERSKDRNLAAFATHLKRKYQGEGEKR